LRVFLVDGLWAASSYLYLRLRVSDTSAHA